VDYTSLVPNVMIRRQLIINCEVDVVDRSWYFKIFLSLDDNLLRLLVDQNSKFHADSNFRWLTIRIRILIKSLDSAQERVEERAYQQRKNLFDYDDVLNKQRNIVYHEKTNFGECTNSKNILRMVNKLSQKFY
jgi:preprotein translocase subunit SecA